MHSSGAAAGLPVPQVVPASSRAAASDALPRIGRVQVVWAIYASVAALTLVTYTRVPPAQMYAVARGGFAGALGRVVTYLDFPVAIAAIGVLLVAARGQVPLVAGALCATAAVAVDPSRLDARWINAPAAIGALLAAGLTLRAGRDAERPLGRVRVVLLVLLCVWSVPWLLAAAGLYAQDVPLLGHVIRSAQPTPGQPQLASVHLGLHDGLFGAQLAATALLLSARPLRRAASLYLALMLCYGSMLAVSDGWHEQVVKRGWSATRLPDVQLPALSVAWACLLVAAAAVHVLWFRREARAACAEVGELTAESGR
jgi:hypothetical protein